MLIYGNGLQNIFIEIPNFQLHFTLTASTKKPLNCIFIHLNPPHSTNQQSETPWVIALRCISSRHINFTLNEAENRNFFKQFSQTPNTRSQYFKTHFFLQFIYITLSSSLKYPPMIRWFSHLFTGSLTRLFVYSLLVVGWLAVVVVTFIKCN